MEASGDRCLCEVADGGEWARGMVRGTLGDAHLGDAHGRLVVVDGRRSWERWRADVRGRRGQCVSLEVGGCMGEGGRKIEEKKKNKKRIEAAAEKFRDETLLPPHCLQTGWALFRMGLCVSSAHVFLFTFCVLFSPCLV